MNRMKNYMLLIILICAYLGYSQSNAVNHYVFSKFTEGEVLLKGGSSFRVLLNYNTLTEEMIFERNNQKLAISDNEPIDTIY